MCPRCVSAGVISLQSCTHACVNSMSSPVHPPPPTHPPTHTHTIGMRQGTVCWMNAVEQGSRPPRWNGRGCTMHVGLCSDWGSWPDPMALGRRNSYCEGGGGGGMGVNDIPKE